ncbi:C2 domain-containing protein, partial [Tanacetum coccineum]
ELQRQVGTLNVKIVRINLKRKLFIGERECFVKVGLTEDNLPSKKMNMIRSLNPEWNEEFSLDLPRKMCMNVVPLKDLNLIPEQQKTLTFDLLKHMDSNHLKNDKSYGQLMIELMYKPLTRDGVVSNYEEANKMKKPLKLAKKSFDPVWNEEVTFSFEKPPTNEILNLELHSSSHISKFLQVTKRGHVNIRLEDIVKKTRTKEMYRLEDTTSGGRLHVELQWRASS